MKETTKNHIAKLLLINIMLLSGLNAVQGQNIPEFEDSNADSSGIVWLDWNTGMESARILNRKAIIKVYTEGCKWCNKMDQETFGDSTLASYIKANFIPIEIDAKSNSIFFYRDRAFKFDKDRGYHALVYELLKDRLAFPTIIFINEKGEVIQNFTGYKGSEKFGKIITYFGMDAYKKMPWDLHSKIYTSNMLKVTVSNKR